MRKIITIVANEIISSLSQKGLTRWIFSYVGMVHVTCFCLNAWILGVSLEIQVVFLLQFPNVILMKLLFSRSICRNYFQCILLWVPDHPSTRRTFGAKTWRRHGDRCVCGRSRSPDSSHSPCCTNARGNVHCTESRHRIYTSENACESVRKWLSLFFTSSDHLSKV